jgi:hypothetical protein
MPAVTDVLISVAQIAFGGSIVQAGVAYFRRKPELRKLDEEADSVAVSTAEKLVLMLRAQVLAMRDDAEDQAGKYKAVVERLDEVDRQLRDAKLEIIRLKYRLKGD